MLKTIIPFLLLFTSCTISFQNISSVGKAQDLVDTDQDAEADVKPNIQIPLSP